VCCVGSASDLHLHLKNPIEHNASVLQDNQYLQGKDEEHPRGRVGRADRRDGVHVEEEQERISNQHHQRWWV
jgi:hypothetical protein